MTSNRALSLIAAALALGIAPDPVTDPASWAADNLIVADGPRAGQKWSPDLTPYCVDILRDLAAESPHNRVSVRKSSQTGLTNVGIAWVGSIIDRTPGKAMVVFPTVLTVRDFNAEKLMPTIEQTDVLRRKISDHRSRSGMASTSLNKRFPGGSLVLTGANSTADLRSKTIKFLFCDEIDDWPLDLDGQGDPMEMADARQIAHHETGDYKKLEASTPTLKGVSRIDRAFEEGDQRYFQVPCPHCGEYQRLEWGGKDVVHGLKFSTTWPHDAHYVCRHCGCRIDHHDKRAMVQAGKWVAEMPEPGRHPSYHIDALTSLLTTWDKIVETFVKAKGSAQKLKTFWNLWLGLAWEERGDAPEWERLFARREAYRARTIPVGGVILTAAADVQLDGIYFEAIAWGRDEQSWSIDIGYVEGATDDHRAGAWLKLEEVYNRYYPDAYGNAWRVDVMMVDAGYNSNAVYEWCRRHDRAKAIKGDPGWYKPAISSTPTKVDINARGKRTRRGAELWHIGTWPLKGALYANLRKEGLRDGAEQDPPGYLHFAEDLHDQRYFQQLTAESIKDREHRGRRIKVWEANGPNHFHDCRIYNMAAAVQLGVGVMSDADWQAWERVRCRPSKPEQGDLLAVIAVDAATGAAPEKTGERRSSKPKKKGRGGFVGGWGST